MKSLSNFITSIVFIALGFFFITSCSKKDTVNPTLNSQNEGQPGTTKSSAKAITGFVIDVSTTRISSTITESAKTIALFVPGGTDVRGLKPIIVVSDNATVSPVSGSSVDFTNPVVYTVKAEDGTTQQYTVTVTVGKSNLKAITSFKFAGGSAPAVVATIDETAKTIKAAIIAETDIKALLPTIILSNKATVSPASGVAQNFSNDVNYTVTAEDGSTQVYKVSVTQAKSLIPTIQWKKTLGGSKQDVANSIVATSDGGFIVVGSTLSTDGDASGNHGKEDFLVAKLNNAGAVVWRKTFGGSNTDYATVVKTTLNGGIYVAGVSYSTDGDVTAVSKPVAVKAGAGASWVIHLSNDGNLQWQRSYALNDQGGVPTDLTFTAASTSTAFELTINGTNLQSANSGTDAAVIRCNQLGEVEWSQIFGGNGNDVIKSIAEVGNGYIVCGSTSSTDGVFGANHGSNDYFIARLNTSGNIIWQKVYGGSGNDEATGAVAVIAPNGGFIVSGYSESDNGNVSGHHGIAGNADIWVIRLKDNGDLDWQRSYGSTGIELASSMRIYPENVPAGQTTGDYNYVIAGSTKGAIDGDVTANHNIGTTDAWFLKINNAGELLWQKSYGGTDADDIKHFTPSSDGYVLAGQSLSNDGDVGNNNGDYDFWVLKLQQPWQ